MPETTPDPSLPQRALAMLRAVAAGRARISLSSEPDLFIDGVPCCDQTMARWLAHRKLVRPTRPGRVGQRVPAALTSAGHDALNTSSAAA